MREQIGARLREALEIGDRSIRSLQLELQDRKASISSYGAVYDYVKGRKAQPLTFLSDAAAVLGVRIEWLVLGSGRSTPQAEALERAVRRGETRFDSSLRELILHAEPELRQFRAPTQELFAQVLARYVLSASNGRDAVESEEGRKEIVELASDLFFIIRLPINSSSWGFERVGLPGKERDLYAVSVLAALDMLIPGPAQGRSIETARESLIRKLREFADKSGPEQRAGAVK
jgi:hypothetical protein